MFETLFNSPFLYSLSLTLVHFLWQGLLVAFILKLLLFIVNKKKSKLRYSLAISAMLTNAILALFTYNIISSNNTVNFESHPSHIALTNLVNELTQQNALFTSQQLLPSILTYSLPYLSLLWLASVTILVFKLLFEIYNVNKLPKYLTALPSETLSARFNVLAKKLQLSSAPTLLISLKAEVPMAIGWLKPVVLLPATMVTGLNSAQLEMLILHELAHIRRHDYLVNFLQTVIELLFFFHPSVHWVGKQIRNEREYCSDDIAVQHCGDAMAYAHTLTDTASLCAKNNINTIPAMAMAASGGDLKARVLRLVDNHCAPTNNTSKLLAAFSLLLALILLMVNQLLTTSFAQQPSQPLSWQETISINESPLIHANMTAPLATTNHNEKATTEDNDPRLQALFVNSDTTDDVKSTELVDNILARAKIQRTNLQVTEKNKVSTQRVTSNVAQPIIEHKTPENFKQDTARVKKQTIATNVKQTVSTVKDQELQSNFLVKKGTIDHDSTLPEPLLNKALNKTATSNKALLETTVVKTTEKNLQRATSAQKLVKPHTDPRLLVVEKTINKHNETNSLIKDNLLQQPLSTSSTQKSPLTTSSNQESNQAVLATASSLDATLLKSITPIYPNLAKRRGIEMEVTVDFTIDRNGKVKDINFIHQNKLIYFKSAIRSAIRQWRFTPAIKNNRKIESKMTKIFSFSLHA